MPVKKITKPSKPTVAPASEKSARDAANAIARRGLLLVLSSPSGAGKTTLAKRVLEHDKKISISVSATTRKPRPGEVDGRDYYFVDDTNDVIVEGAGGASGYDIVTATANYTLSANVEQLVIQGAATAGTGGGPRLPGSCAKVSVNAWRVPSES